MKRTWSLDVRLTRPAWLEKRPALEAVTWQSMVGRLKRRQVAGLAALFVTSEGVGVVHVERQGQEAPCVRVCAFQTVARGQAPGKVAQTLIKSQKLEKARFVGVLDRSAYALFPAEPPDLPREEWATAMKWRIKDQIQFPVTQAVLELFDMPGGGGAGSESGRVYVAAAKDGEIRRHVQLFVDAGVQLSVLDIPELALLNLTRWMPEAREGMVLLHLESQSGLVMVIKDGQFYLARRMESGAEALEREGGAGLANSPFLDRVALEVQRTMDYYESHFGQGAVGMLQIAPLPVAVPGVREGLAERLGMRVKYMNLREILTISDTVADGDLARALLAMGAAVRDMDPGV